MVKLTLSARSSRALLAVALFAAPAIASCGGTDVPPPPQKLSVMVYGWGPGEGSSAPRFIDQMPQYEGARSVRLIARDLEADRIVAQEVGQLEQGALRLPELPYERPIRIELEVRDDSERVIATGSSSVLTITDDTPARGVRMFVSPVNEFAPSGALVRNSQDELMFVTSELDTRAADRRDRDAGGSGSVWLGRTGHASALTEDGRVLIVGGTQNILPDSIEGSITMSSVYGDVQIYDPETGYFTDLSWDEERAAPQAMDRDRLGEPRAFHTVTALGGDRFIVAGGYTVRQLGETKQTRPVGSLEFIDLNAPLGERVTSLDDNNQTQLQLALPRAFHRAAYLEQEGKLLLIGGRGQALGVTQAEDEVLSEVEIVDLVNLRVIAQRFDSGVARAGMEVEVLDDKRVFVAGGRNIEEGVLASTQIVEVGASGLSFKPGPSLNQARYDFGMEIIPSSQGRSVVVVGGYTDQQGAVSGSVELGVVDGQAGFSRLSNEALTTARGGLSAVTLPNTGDVMVFGGRDAQSEIVTRAERLQFNGLTGSPVYEVAEGDYGDFYLARYAPSYTLMRTGHVLIFGGIGVERGAMMRQVTFPEAELYNPFDPVGAVR